jgi:hypothetical protein
MVGNYSIALIELVVEVAYEHMQGEPLSPPRAFPAVARIALPDLLYQ